MPRDTRRNMKLSTYGNPNNPALVFFHAFPFPSEMWTDQLKVFSEKYFCLAPDYPGFGETPLPTSAATFEAYADYITDYLQDAKVKTAIWCGLSMGGYMAMRLYERAPEQCRALILCNTRAGADGNEAKLKRWDTIKALQKDRAAALAGQWQGLTGPTAKLNAAYKKRFEEIVNKVPTPTIAAGLVALATRNDSTETLAKIKVPTLIIVGDEDAVTPVKESEAMHKAIKGSTLKILENTGHLSNMENPNMFNKHVAEFLATLK